MSALNSLKALCSFIALGLILSMVTGCSLGEASKAPEAPLDGAFCVPKSEILFARPDYESIGRDQILLIKISNLLETRAVTAQERAEAFYELGIIYDRLGLEATARSMFMNALSENRKFAAPYNFVGIYFAADGRFQEALDAFDAGLELDPKDVYINFNRGIVLYYAGRAKTALEDFGIFYRADPNDPYRLLWLYLVESKLLGCETAHDRLQARFTMSSADAVSQIWGFNLVRYYLGELDKQAFFNEIRSHENVPDEYADHLCEAYFYLGKLSELDGDDKLAYDYMQLAVSTRRYAFLEYRYALRELSKLRRAHGYPERKADIRL